MPATLNFPAVAYLIAVVLGMVVSVICWFYPYKDQSFRLLGASFFSLVWMLFTLFLTESSLMYWVPEFFQTGFIGSIVYLPLSYLFVRTNFYGKGLSVRDIIHILPLVVFLIDYSAIYLLPPSEKMALILSDKNSGYLFYDGNFIPAYMHRTVRFVLFMIYSTLQFTILLRSKKSYNPKVWYYVAAQFLMVLYYFAYQLTQDPLAWRLVSVSLSFYLLVITIALIAHPRLLYSVEEMWDGTPLNKSSEREKTDYNNEKKVGDILRRLDAFMDSETPYLRHGYSISQLSNAMHIPKYQLSAFLNRHKKLSFNDYMNMHRIAFCKKRIRQGAAELLTLEALAFECGFNNRNSFTAAFKHFSGTTPSEFLRMQKEADLVAKES